MKNHFIYIIQMSKKAPSLLTKFNSCSFGEVTTVKCDTVFEALYAVKKPDKIHRNPVFKWKMRVCNENDNTEDTQAELDDVSIKLLKTQMGCDSLSCPQELQNENFAKARKHLRMAKIQIIDENKKTLTPPEEVDSKCKHIIYKKGKWHAVLIGNLNAMDKKEMRELEDDFTKHMVVLEKKRAKDAESTNKAHLEMTEFVRSFLAKNSKNLERVQRYEQTVKEVLKEELEREYLDKHADRRFKPLEKNLNTDKFKKWFKKEMKNRLKRLTQMTGGAPSSKQDGPVVTPRPPFRRLPGIRKTKNRRSSSTTPNPRLVEAATAVLEMNKGNRELKTEITNLQTIFETIKSIGNEYVKQNSPNYPNLQADERDYIVDTSVSILDKTGQPIRYQKFNTMSFFYLLTSMNLITEEQKQEPTEMEIEKETPKSMNAFGGGQAVYLSSLPDKTYQSIRLAADLHHDFKYNLSKIRPDMKQFSTKWSSEDGFMKWVITDMLTEQPELIKRFSVKTETEWQNNITGNLQESFGGNQNMVIDGVITSCLVSGINCPPASKGASAGPPLQNGITKIITYAHIIDPFSASLQAVNQDFYSDPTAQLQILNDIFNNFFANQFGVGKFVFDLTVDGDNNLNISINNKAFETKIEAQEFSIKTIEKHIAKQQSKLKKLASKLLQNKKNNLDQLYDGGKNVLNDIEETKLFLMMFKEIGDHIQLHELKRNKIPNQSNALINATNFASQDRILYTDAIFQNMDVLFPIESFHSKFHANHLKVIYDLNSINDDDDDENSNASSSASPNASPKPSSSASSTRSPSRVSSRGNIKYVMCFSKTFQPVSSDMKQVAFWKKKIDAFRWRFKLDQTENSVFNSTFNELYIQSFNDIQSLQITTMEPILSMLNVFFERVFFKQDLKEEVFGVRFVYDFSKAAYMIDILFDTLLEMHSLYNDGVYIQSVMRYVDDLHHGFEQLKNHYDVAQKTINEVQRGFIRSTRRSKNPMGTVKDIFKNIKDTITKNTGRFERNTNIINLIVKFFNHNQISIDTDILHDNLRRFIKQPDGAKVVYEQIAKQIELIDPLLESIDRITFAIETLLNE